jgi:hypothetical protein
MQRRWNVWVVVIMALFLLLGGGVAERVRAFEPLFDTRIDYGVGVGPYSVTTGDLDGDGDLDLAVANLGSDTVSVLLGNGDGTFQTHVQTG